MTTKVETLVDNVFRKLRQANGRDVQLHTQDFVVYELQTRYRLMNQKYVLRDYLNRNDFTLDSSGQLQLADATTANLTRFNDIVAVYPQNEDKPYPFATAKRNMQSIQRPRVYATGSTNIFGVSAVQAEDIHLVNKNWSKDDFTLDTDLDFYDDLLISGATLSMAEVAGVNDRMVSKMQREYVEWLALVTMDELMDEYATNEYGPDTNTQWTVDP